MGITVDQERARAVLQRAVDRARSSESLPSEWIARTDQLAASPNKTYISALGTQMLARATDSRANVFSLKEGEPQPGSHSARNLAKNVFVPVLAIEGGIDLGTRGREPLNNSPFFRQSSIDTIPLDGVKSPAAHEFLLDCLSQLDLLGPDDAADALAALVRARIRATDAHPSIHISSVDADALDVMLKTVEFVVSDPELGRRGEAFVAAGLSLFHEGVINGNVYDPDRTSPGDVQVLKDEKVLIGVQVRQKPADRSDVLLHAARLREHSVDKGMFVALHPAQGAIESETSLDALVSYGVAMEVHVGAVEFITHSIARSMLPTDQALRELVIEMTARLDTAGVSAAGLNQWQALWR